MKKYLLIILATFLTLNTFILAHNTIVIGNVPYTTTDIDSITIDIEDKSTVKKLWKNGDFKCSDITSGENIRLFEGFEISDTIYQFSTYDFPWKKAYLTPIGLFYIADYTSIIAYNDNDFDREDYKGDEFWHYESFDKLHTADMAVSNGYILRELEHNGGEIYISYGDSVSIEHYYTENYRLTQRYNSYKPISDESCDLQKNLWIISQTFDSYSYDDNEHELESLINSFISLIGLPVTTLDESTGNDIAISTKEAAKKVKKKFQSANFAIVPMTYDVRGIYDESVRNINGSLRCASYKGLNTLEYGILVDKNPANLTSDKASIKIPLKQHGLKLSFTAYANGLKSGTTYYYTTYCKIPKSELETYHFRYGDQKRTEGYGHIKSFTTPKALWIKVEVNSPSPYVESTDYKLFLRHVNYYYDNENKFKNNYNGSIGKKNGWNYDTYHRWITKNIDFGVEPPIPCPPSVLADGTPSESSEIRFSDYPDYLYRDLILPSFSIYYSCGAANRVPPGHRYWSYGYSYDIHPCFTNVNSMFDRWIECIGSARISCSWVDPSCSNIAPWHHEYYQEERGHVDYNITYLRKDDGSRDTSEGSSQSCCSDHCDILKDKSEPLRMALETKFRLTYMGSADDIYDEYYVDDLQKSKRASEPRKYGYGAAKPERESGINIQF